MVGVVLNAHITRGDVMTKECPPDGLRTGCYATGYWVPYSNGLKLAFSREILLVSVANGWVQAVGKG